MNIFISYAKQDGDLVDKLIKFLDIYQRNSEVSYWSDKQILPGEDQKNLFSLKLEQADLIVLCLSPDYLASENIWENQIEKSLERHYANDVIIVPILFRPCPLNITKLSKLQSLPREGKAITSRYWKDFQDECFNEICSELIKALYLVRSKYLEDKIATVKDKETYENFDYDFNDKELLEKEFDELRKNKTDIRSLVKSSPFDKSNDIDGFLTKRIFFDSMYVSSDVINTSKKELYDSLDNIVSVDRVVFLSGFAGNGKTTFINSFMKDYEEFDHIYYDFSDRTTNKSTIARNDKFRRFSSSAEVINLLHRNLRGDLRFFKTFRFIIENRFELKDYGLVTYEVYEQLELLKDKSSKLAKEDIVNCMKYFHFKDSLSAFFMHIFLNYSTDRKKIIYFDNLDVVSIEYITSEFLVAFEESLVNGRQLSRSSLFKGMNLKFAANFRFVFCLREANNALINKHILDRIGLKKIEFKVNFGSDFYKTIIEKRVALIKEIYSKEELRRYGFSITDLMDGIKVLTEDDYFNEVFIPLFNYDYRDAIDALFYTITDYRVQDRTWIPYGVRAMLMYGLVKKMQISNFLREYPSRYPEQSDGYCLIDRVVLTFLLNKCEYYRKVGEFDHSKSISLTNVLEGLSKIYRVDEILESIARCFLYHEKSWVHLLTIYGTKVTKESRFIEEYIKCFVVDVKTKKLKILNKEKLDSVRLKINPAGFVYLRYVLMHFEFYSVLTKNKKPLFLYSGKKLKNGCYDYETTIDHVYKLAERHTVNMRLFFDTRYTQAGMNEVDFFKSDYCFRHIGRSEGYGREVGHFHSTRIISSHINHLDQFRILLLSKSSFDDSEKRRINKNLTTWIKKYVDLWKVTKDKKVINDLINPILNSILIIERSKFLDFKTHINADNG